MRIGIFDPYLDDLGGGEKYMMSIAQCLSDNNYIDIFWDNPNDLIRIKERFSINTSAFHLVPNIFSPKFSTKERFLMTRKYDVIIYLSDGSIPFVGSKKLYLHIQQPLEKVDRSFKFSLKLKRVVKVIFNSEFTKHFVQKNLQKKGIVLYPPIFLDPKKTPKENIILHVGRFRVNNVSMDDYKKQHFMINVFKEMVDSGLKNWKLVLAVSIHKEDEEEFSKMKKSASGYPIEFLVNQSNKDLWNIYSRAKIYWHASGFGEDLEKHPQRAEHFGISTVEAMGAGAVPVVINAGGQKEIVEDGKSGFVWSTLEDFISKTKKLISDKKLWDEMSIGAISRSKIFSGDRFCRDLKNIIK